MEITPQKPLETVANTRNHISNEEAEWMRGVCVEMASGKSSGVWVDSHGRTFKFGITNDPEQSFFSRGLFGQRTIHGIAVDDSESGQFTTFTISQRRQHQPRLGVRKLEKRGLGDTRYDNPEDRDLLMTYIHDLVQDLQPQPQSGAELLTEIEAAVEVLEPEDLTRLRTNSHVAETS